MRTLVLQLDEELIRHAEVYSAKTGKSLSELVADYLDVFREEPRRASLDSEPPAAAELRRRPVASVIAKFWETFARRVSTEAEVFAFAGPVAPNAVRDALQRPLDHAPDIGSAYVFFVDQKPDANWAHDCAYAFVSRDGKTAWCDASWPPAESFELEPVTHP